MPHRPALVERALARPRLLAAVGAVAFVVTAACSFAIVGGGVTDDDGHELDAARLAADATTTTSTVVPTTSTSSTTTSTTTTVAPTTTPAPTTTTPPPPPTTAAPVAPAAPPPPAPAAAPSGSRCLVRLHGKGGNGGGSSQSGGVTVLSPAGNAAGWSGKQWLYFAPASYEAALASVTQAVDAGGCGQVIVDGFSNGGAMAVKLYCRGESFGGRLVGVVADDPVPDHGADGCAPAPGVALTMYWTGALDGAARPGWNCAEQDWTCEGGTTVGIGAYAANAGTAPKKSPYNNHQWYTGAPELAAWR